MKDKLRVRDYLHIPLVELVDHPDFDEKYFWIAATISDAPMRELSERLDHEWLNSIETSE